MEHPFYIRYGHNFFSRNLAEKPWLRTFGHHCAWSPSEHIAEGELVLIHGRKVLSATCSSPEAAAAGRRPEHQLVELDCLLFMRSSAIREQQFGLSHKLHKIDV
jgi:hypothetical protein